MLTSAPGLWPMAICLIFGKQITHFSWLHTVHRTHPYTHSTHPRFTSSRWTRLHQNWPHMLDRAKILRLLFLLDPLGLLAEAAGNSSRENHWRVPPNVSILPHTIGTASSSRPCSYMFHPNELVTKHQKWQRSSFGYVTVPSGFCWRITGNVTNHETSQSPKASLIPFIHEHVPTRHHSSEL